MAQEVESGRRLYAARAMWVARDLGFRFVESGPLVRSSYHAAKPFQAPR